MTDPRHETLSAFMDGELQGGDAEIIGTLLREDAARQTWLRYHLISDCLRRSLPAHLDRSFGRRVSLALQAEATVLAPALSTARAALRPLAGLAVAASVAAVAILGIQHQRAGQPVDSASTVASAQTPALTEPMRRTFTLAAGTSGGAVNQEAAGAATAPARPAYTAAKLNRYLVNYNEYRRNSAVQGMFPYVRLVAPDRDE